MNKVLKNYRTMMLAEYIGINVLETVRWGLSAALAAALLATVLLLVGVSYRVLGRERVIGAA